MTSQLVLIAVFPNHAVKLFSRLFRLNHFRKARRRVGDREEPCQLPLRPGNRHSPAGVAGLHLPFDLVDKVPQFLRDIPLPRARSLSRDLQGDRDEMLAVALRIALE